MISCLLRNILRDDEHIDSGRWWFAGLFRSDTYRWSISVAWNRELFSHGLILKQNIFQHGLKVAETYMASAFWPKMRQQPGPPHNSRWLPKVRYSCSRNGRAKFADRRLWTVRCRRWMNRCIGSRDVDYEAVALICYYITPVPEVSVLWPQFHADGATIAKTSDIDRKGKRNIWLLEWFITF